ncbi:YlcI/YnfO family protein [Xenorhabdus bovienii]|uniref:YlcI/YnfO family protein n=1 Tax=Xenorhabdus bovienii TaxID=40576 RepID=UPI0023B24BFC|nr:YlcI/YnfO family protein [Xenorhabdus bovienii]
MTTGYKNNRSTTKGIRFPHELINEINTYVNSDKSINLNANFSAWVIDACEKKIKSEKRKNKS